MGNINTAQTHFITSRRMQETNFGYFPKSLCCDERCVESARRALLQLREQTKQCRLVGKSHMEGSFASLCSYKSTQGAPFKNHSAKNSPVAEVILKVYPGGVRAFKKISVLCGKMVQRSSTSLIPVVLLLFVCSAFASPSSTDVVSPKSDAIPRRHGLRMFNFFFFTNLVETEILID